MRRVRKLKGVGSASPGWGLKREKSMVRPSRRGGVPVLRRQWREAQGLGVSLRKRAEAGGGEGRDGRVAQKKGGGPAPPGAGGVGFVPGGGGAFGGRSR